MMWKTKRYAQTSALPAIAAALALTSTPAWSQEVTPPSSTPEPTVSTSPTTVDSTPVELDSVRTTPSAPIESTTASVAPATAKRTATTAKLAAKKPAGTSLARAKAPAAARPAASTAAAAPAPVQQPIVDARPPEAATATPAPEAIKPTGTGQEEAMMLGGGALALLALGAGAVAVTRRRKEDDEVIEETTTDESIATAEPARAEPSPVYEEQPAIVEPPAFAWGNPQPAEQSVERRNGETWVERAQRGPTPDNPSLSLRKRLKRAAFFDAREQRVATGQAERVPADAGLPERELELA